MLGSLKPYPVVAVVAAVVTSVATLYVLLGAGFLKPSKKKLKGPRGLQNYGRACYMNAVLQAFASSQAVQDWLAQCRPTPLKQGLLKCIRVLNRIEEDPNEEINPSYLLSALRSHGFVLTSDEQDAHELFQGLLDAIELDSKFFLDQVPEDQSISLSDAVEESDHKLPGVVNKLGESAASRALAMNDESISPFCGTITSRVDNKVPSTNSPTRSTIFNNVTLYLPRRTDLLANLGINTVPITLESLLQSFVALEAVDESTKQQSFARLPKCLCLHIQRTGFDSGVAYKRTDRVLFPLHLNMDQFVYAQQLVRRKSKLGDKDRSQSEDQPSSPMTSRNNYILCAVICHFGDIEAGHYITYRKCKWSCGRVRWHYTSDGDVRQVALEEVLSSNPYLLLYERLA